MFLANYISPVHVTSHTFARQFQKVDVQGSLEKQVYLVTKIYAHQGAQIVHATARLFVKKKNMY